MNKCPKVSISVICYNQAKYIGDCLESVLAQKVSFPIEIIVGDDASKDGTQAIVLDYQERYPNLIRSFLRKENTGGTENYYGVVAMCKGEYVAHIDGDDRMLPGKLEKQVAFLDAYPECSMVVHRVNEVRASDGKLLGKLPRNAHPTISDINYLVQNYQFFVSSSTMYRRPAKRLPLRTQPTTDMLFYV